MTIEEMIAKCRKQQEITGKVDAEVMFIIPGRWGKRNTRRLFPGGPKGEIVAETERGVHCFFRADEVIAALERGMCLCLDVLTQKRTQRENTIRSR